MKFLNVLSGSRFNLLTQWRGNWKARARIAADLITKYTDPDCTVADLGCGDQKLRKVLKGRDYRGFDLIPQSSDVAALDLTTDTFPSCGVTVLLGVLEYIPIAPALEKVDLRYLVISHLYPDEGDFSAETIKTNGWANLLSKAEFEASLENAGFHILECVKGDRQHIWMAERR